MKELIKQLLREAIENKIGEWESNISDFDKVLGTPIWIDGETGEMFYAFVGFNSLGKVESYSYSFMLLDGNNKPKTGYMTERDEVTKYIPKELKNNKQILPIIEGLTRKLLDKMIPEEIYRRTVEPLTGDSLERYNRITNIMINEYGYTLDKTYTDDKGCTIWILTKKNQTDNNKEMNETYEIGGVPNGQQLLKDTFDWVLPLLPKRNKTESKDNNK
jgi:hypothetical protein